MKCKILSFQQGDPEWDLHRASHYNASEAPVVTGDATGRIELLDAKKTGLQKEFDAYLEEVIFPKGHQFEAWARPKAEEFCGMELFPVTVAANVTGLPLSYSSDGLAAKDVLDLENPNYTPPFLWEHKQLNQENRALAIEGKIHPKYYPQMDQGMLLTGAKRCLFTVSDWNPKTGVCLEIYHIWYERNLAGAQKVIAAWRVFDDDLKTHVVRQASPKLVGETIEMSLPSIDIKVEGKVLSSNLDLIKARADEIRKTINMAPKTDQDFADAEQALKFCSKVEDSTVMLEERVLAEIEEIANALDIIKGIRSGYRNTRLALEKIVKNEKDARKRALLIEHFDLYQAHIEKLNAEFPVPYMPDIDVRFGDVIKGLKSIDSMREKLAQALADAKIDADATASVIRSNLKALSATGYTAAIMPDLLQVITKDPADFKNLLAVRVQALEADRLQKESKPVEEEAPPPEMTVDDDKVVVESPDQEEVEIGDTEAADDEEEIVTGIYNLEELRAQIEPYLESTGLSAKTCGIARKHIAAFINFMEDLDNG